MRLQDKVALVTGASRGIGRETALVLGSHGASIIVNYLSQKEEADSVVREIVENGGKAIALQADVQQLGSTKTLIARAEEALGPIDVLVLSAAPPAAWKQFLDLGQEEFENKLLQEIRGYFLPAQVVSARMVQRRTGSIIGLSSGLSRSPQVGFCSHTVAKAAVDGLMRSLALELAPFGVRVNIVAPGLTHTPGSSWVPQEGIDGTIQQTPMGRLVTLREIATAILMLASEDAAFVTGAYLPVSGGMILP